MSELLEHRGHEGALTEQGRGLDALSERIENAIFTARRGSKVVVDDHQGHRVEAPFEPGTSQETDVAGWTDNMSTWQSERFCDHIALQYRATFTGDDAERTFLASDPEISLV